MSSNSDVQPFHIQIPQADLDDLRSRLDRTRWPHPLPDLGWSRGVPLEYLQALTAYWADGFDWSAQESKLNAIPQFVTTLDGQPIHFLHVRSPEAEAVPLLMTHGWPSSPFEFLNVIGPLTDPRAHGGDPNDAFHLIIPSLPGYGFSTPVSETGWGNLFRVAQAWLELMRRLGYARFAVHGTDVGSGVAGLLGMLATNQVLGIHLTGTMAAMPFGPPVAVDVLSDDDRARGERFNRFQLEGLGYLHMQATRPQTLAYALTDSPVGQLAWIVEKFQEWTDPAANLPDDAVDRDQLLTNVSIAWFNAAGGSSAHATYEGMQVYRQMAVEQHGQESTASAPEQSGPPMAVAVFAADTTIRGLMDPTGRIAHWSTFDRGGHFPAMEVPDLLVADIRAFVRGAR